MWTGKEKEVFHCFAIKKEDCHSLARSGTGIIEEREFLGEFVRYVVRVGDATLIADQAHYAGHRIYERNDRTRVGLDPAHARLLER